MKKLKIYVAGPITNTDTEVVKRNINNAKYVGEQLFKKGHLPYVPHTHFSGWDVDMHEHYDILMEHGLNILSNWADAIFYLGASNGADIEKQKAEQLKLKIFTSLSDIEKAE